MVASNRIGKDLRMRFSHKITLNGWPDRLEVLTRLGIDFKGPILLASSLVWFTIAESHPAWGEIKRHIPEWDAGDNTITEFTRAEMDNATLWHMAPAWHWGYPQPEDDFGYKKLSFDLTNFCATCGIGKTQNAPIRLLGEPKWGKKRILQLNWVFGEYFVRPEVWAEIFRPLGVECRPVVHHKTEKELKTIVQLRIEKSATSRIALPTDHPTELCMKCDRVKFNMRAIGFFPKFVVPQTEAIFHSQEFFGSGGSAWNAIFVGRELFEKIREMKPSGVGFWPVADGSPHLISLE